MSFQAPALWPEGVIDRYVTYAAELLQDANVTVDVSTEDLRTTGRCRGCGTSWGNYSCYEHTVKKWAQEHAEKCRALPRPTA